MIKLKELVDRIKIEKIIGSTDHSITRAISALSQHSTKDTITWVSDKNFSTINWPKLGTIICSQPPGTISPDATYLLTPNPRKSFQEALAILYPDNMNYTIASTAKIDSQTHISAKVEIGENVVIEANVEIGENCRIGHNTVIKSGTKIGKSVIIGCNCTIGGTGFGYEKDDFGNFIPLKHIGGVEIHDNVEIGNNTCIDQGVLSPTIIEFNVKIDNLVHIAHNVVLKKNCLVIANAMVAGSVTIGENCWIAPSSSIKNGVSIGQDATIGLGAVVLKNVLSEEVVVGNPAKKLIK